MSYDYYSLIFLPLLKYIKDKEVINFTGVLLEFYVNLRFQRIVTAKQFKFKRLERFPVLYDFVPTFEIVLHSTN